MLGQDLSSQTLNAALASASDSSPKKKALTLAFDNNMLSSHCLKNNNTDLDGSDFCGHDTLFSDKITVVGNNSFGYSLGDITSSDLDFFENAENKYSGNFLLYDWPEIQNFEDVDSMFRNCDSVFGLGVNKEDQLGWLSSLTDLGGSGDVLKSDVKFPCPETNVVESISESHNSSQDSSINDSAMIGLPIRSKDSSWTSEKTDCCVPSVNGPPLADTKDGFVPHKQGLEFNGQIFPRISTYNLSRTGSGDMINKNDMHIKLQSQSDGRSSVNYSGNGSLNHINELPNEVMQLPSGLTCHQTSSSVQMLPASCPKLCSYLQNHVPLVHSDNSHLSDPASVHTKLSTVKSEGNGLVPIPLGYSSHTSSQLHHRVSPHDPRSEVSDLAVCQQREKLHSCQGSQSSINSSLKDGSATISDLGSVEKCENYGDPEGVSLAYPAELGSSNVHKNLTMSLGLDDISLEAASFFQLQQVTEQLDLRTRLCIRDSLYRLAQSADQRHNHASLDVGCGDERESGMAEGTNKCNQFMDVETDTNPIDRSIARILFHRASDSPSAPAQNSFPFESPTTVHGSVASPLAIGREFD